MDEQTKETLVVSPMGRTMTASEKQYWEIETLSMYEKAEMAFENYERQFSMAVKKATADH